MRTVDQISDEVLTGRGKASAVEFDILDLVLILAARKYTIMLATIGGALIFIGLVLLVPPSYTAKAVIMPPADSQSIGSAMMGQFGALASMTGMGSSLGIKNPSDLYIGILQSQTIADRLIKRFDLMRHYKTDKPSLVRNALKGSSKFVAEKNGMISISFTDGDPVRAAAIANAYVDELYNFNNRIALGPAAQRRLFFEQQLAAEKDRLADSEVALKKTQEATGVIAPSGQTEEIIRQVAQLQAQITDREVALDSLRTSSTDQNPDVIRLSTELDGLRRELRALESGNGKRNPGDITIATANVPQAGLEYIRKEREVKYHQLLFDLLARQYEAARMDEAKAAPVIQVVDPALVPDRKSAPFRALWALVGWTLGFCFSCAWVLASYVYHRLEADEEQGRRLALLKQELRLRG